MAITDRIRIFSDGNGEAFRAFLGTVADGDEIWINTDLNWSDITSDVILNKELTIRGIGRKRPVITGDAAKDLFNVEADIRIENIEFNTWEDVFNFEHLSKVSAEFIDCKFDTCNDCLKADLGNAGLTRLIVYNCEFASLTRRGVNWDDPIDECIIENCKVSGAVGAGFRVYTNLNADQENIKSVTVRGCRIVDVTTPTAGNDCHGIMVGGLYANIDGNYVEDITNTGDGTNAEGIYLKCQWGNITNNHVVDGSDDGSNASITIKGGLRSDTSDAQGYQIVCANNHCSRTSEWAGKNITGIHIQAEQVIIRNNTVENLQKGISANAEALSDVIIEGNLIFNCYGDGIDLPASGDNWIVRDNIIRVTTDITLDAGFFAIDVTNLDGDHVQVKDNIIDIENPSGGGGGESGGILIKNCDGSWWQVYGNTIYAVTGNSGSPGSEGYGLRIIGSTFPANVDIRDNQFVAFGSGDAAFQTSMTDAQFVANRVRLGENRGYDNEAIEFTDDDTTPSVGGYNGNLFTETYTVAAANVTAFDDGYDGQVIHVEGQSGNFTVEDSATIALRTTPTTVAAGEILSLVRYGGVWREI